MTAKPYTPDIQIAMEQSLDFANLRRVVHAHVAEALADHRIANAQRIVIGGSGDSWFSALSVAPAFRRWTGLVTEARTAMELARYEIPGHHR
jgi:glucosamine 6-phosphate synthetase-like amidotransferase/phosphosugar isomerase protein